MPVYRTEVSLDGLVITGPTLSATEFGTRPAIFISAYDDTNVWALEARLAYHSYSSGPVLFEYRAEFYVYFSVPFNGDPGTGSFVSGTFFIVDSDGNNGSAITSGFTMAIEKDEAADELRFVTPLGTITKTLSGFGAQDASPLRMDSMAHQFVRSNLGNDGSSSWDWFDFYSKNAGVNFRGAALSTAAPGAWSGWTDVTFGSPSGPIANSANSQEASRYRTKFTYVGADGARAGGSRQWRNWVGGDTVDTASAAALLDMTRAREHGAIWATYAYNISLDSLQYRRTFDKGASSAEGAIYSAGGTSNTSPSINWFHGRLFAVWHNGIDILQSVSHDMGTTWGTPVTLSGITGTNPRHVVDDNGLSYYFWVDGTDLKLKRSSDFGQSFLDASPITVVGGITAQSVDCEIAPDGSLFLAYIASNVWTQLRSRDLGKTWA